MPCYRCGRVQTDPAKGSSPWARGVLKDEQVLICPDCQRAEPAWAEAFDRCRRCGGTRLSKMLGETICRSCGPL